MAGRAKDLPISLFRVEEVGNFHACRRVGYCRLISWQFQHRTLQQEDE